MSGVPSRKKGDPHSQNPWKNDVVGDFWAEFENQRHPPGLGCFEFTHPCNSAQLLARAPKFAPGVRWGRPAAVAP